METITPERCAELIREADCAVALTGAGVSTAAGIPDFRGPNGIYATGQYDAERVFDIECFKRDPLPFFDFTRDLLHVLDTIQPTFTHRFLAALEEQGMIEGVITQNIDPLHQQAGSNNVIAVHGNYATGHCATCGTAFDYAWMRAEVESVDVPRCDCGGVVKPDVVFFGEQLRDLDRAQALVARADLMIVLGSSLTVYPAALLPRMTPGDVVVVNKGTVGLEPGPRRWFAETDLDAFFRPVAAKLAINC